MKKYQVYIEFGGSKIMEVFADSYEQAESYAMDEVYCGDAEIDFVETQCLDEEED